MTSTPERGVTQKRQQPEQTSSRAWQACQPCRSRKVKCDGKKPCHNCSSRGQTCEFPEAKDHASASRYYATTFEARCQKLEAMSEKLELITTRLSRVVEEINQAQPSFRRDSSLTEATHSAAVVLQSLPNSAEETCNPAPLTLVSTAGQYADRQSEALAVDDNDDQFYDSSESNTSYDKFADLEESNFKEGAADQAVALVTDSYGRLRFVGGATNKMLIDAMKGMSPSSQSHPTTTPGSSTEASASELQNDESPSKDGDVELPNFIRGKTWPELPFLPKPEQLSCPPQYVSDLLIGIYFDKLHYTFPVLFKPHFMQRYGKMLRSGPQSSPAASDKDFLMVFFAVCACASGLLGSVSDSGFPGIEYYEKALLLHYASAGQASLERVQCLGLLAMCTASWNTLAHSWSLAGQAVRLSMDIGFHVNSKYMTLGVSSGSSMHGMEMLQHHIARRTWWSVFCLERVVSICLGRPVAVDEKDCCCEFPLDLSDEDLEQHCLRAQQGDSHSPPKPSETSSLTGFLAFARLCHISVKIQQLSAPMRLRQLSSFNTKRSTKYLSRVASLDLALRKWLETLPDSVRFSANAIEQPSGGQSGLVMCVIVFIVHAGSLLSLYRCLAHGPNHTQTARTRDTIKGATAQCISAAKSCINAAELVRDLVPSSHYLAICVHYLTLSGVALLRMSKQPLERTIIADAEMCVGLLKDLELRWSGAGRSRAIIEHLLSESVKETRREVQHADVSPEEARDYATAGQKRPFVDSNCGIDVDLEGTMWRDMMWPEIMDGSDLLAFGSWGNVP